MSTIGWWNLEVTGVDDLTDTDKEHIAKCIVDGFTSGQIVQEEYFRCQDPMHDAIDIAAEFQEGEHGEHVPTANFDHNQWYIICLDCGASWSVNDAETQEGEEYFSFEQIDEGDGYCLNKE